MLKHTDIRTVTVFGYLILFSIDIKDFNLLVFFDRDISNTRDTAGAC